MEVLSLAGGLRQDAGSRVKISRPIERGQVPLITAQLDLTRKFSVGDVDVKSLMSAARPADNILIQPHDVITVPEADVADSRAVLGQPGEQHLGL